MNERRYSKTYDAVANPHRKSGGRAASTIAVLRDVDMQVLLRLLKTDVALDEAYFMANLWIEDRRQYWAPIVLYKKPSCKQEAVSPPLPAPSGTSRR